MDESTLIIKNAGQLLTCGAGLKRGLEMQDLGILNNVDIVCSKGKIVYIGVEKYPAGLNIKDAVVIDASAKVVMPGFVDCHTHLIFAGDRIKDWKARMDGVSYQQIAAAGGGIMSTVRATREANEETLYDSAAKIINKILTEGTTSCEIKSGYGLNLENELKILKVANKIKNNSLIDVATTFLGAHAIPSEYKEKRGEYIKLIVDEMIPMVAKNNLAEFCDVFCDEGYFSVAESRSILEKGKEYGLIPKIHADELTYTGGAELAAELNAISAEHLLCISDAGIKAIAEKGVIAVLLPTTSFFLKGEIPPVRKMIEKGVAIALGTDFNPGTSYCYSMPLTIGFACYYYKMKVEEAIIAATINAAYAINRGNLLGSVQVGKQADLLIFNIPSYEYLVYQFGINKPTTVIKKGKIVYKENQSAN